MGQIHCAIWTNTSCSVCRAQILVSGPHQTDQPSTRKKKKQISQFFNKNTHTHISPSNKGLKTNTKGLKTNTTILLFGRQAENTLPYKEEEKKPIVPNVSNV